MKGVGYSEWSTKLPLVLFLSVEIPGASFRSFIGSKVPPEMKLKQFLLPSTRRRCDAVVKAALLEGNDSLHLWAGGLALLNCEASLPALLRSIRVPLQTVLLSGLPLPVLTLDCSRLQWRTRSGCRGGECEKSQKTY